MLFIFDLDGTLIDSSHRQLTDSDGKLDLDHWREHSTPEKIARDSLTRLGRDVADYLKHSNAVHIACTARVMSEHDHAFLLHNELRFDAVLSRPVNCTDSDVILKDMLLRAYAQDKGIPFARLMRTAVFWEDNEAIRNHFAPYGVNVQNPIPYNEVFR